MYGPVRIQGRGYGEGVFQAGLGTPLVLISLWALSLGVGARKPLFVDALFAVLALAGTIMIATGFQALRQRTVEVDESGVRVKLGGHVDWQATWGEVEAIGTRAAVGELGDVGVFVRTQSDEYTLTVGANFGPRRHLAGAFKAMATQAPAGVRVEDDFGWITFGRPPVDRGHLPESPHFGVWHPTFGFQRELDDGRVTVVALLMVIPLMGIIGGMESGLAGAVNMMVVAGVLMAIVIAFAAAWIFAASAKAFRFDREGIEVRYPLATVRARWGDIMVCRADRERPAVYVGKGPPRLRTMGPTPLYACEEVRADLMAAFEAAHYWTKEARDQGQMHFASPA